MKELRLYKSDRGVWTLMYLKKSWSISVPMLQYLKTEHFISDYKYKRGNMPYIWALISALELYERYLQTAGYINFPYLKIKVESLIAILLKLTIY